MVVLIILLFIEFLYHLVTDFTKITKGININHNAFVRILIFGIVLILDYSLGILLMTIYLTSFNITLNLLRGYSPKYLGRKAKTDRLIRFIKINPIVLYVIINLIALTLYLYEKVDFRFSSIIE